MKTIVLIFLLLINMVSVGQARNITKPNIRVNDMDKATARQKVCAKMWQAGAKGLSAFGIGTVTLVSGGMLLVKEGKTFLRGVGRKLLAVPAMLASTLILPRATWGYQTFLGYWELCNMRRSELRRIHDRGYYGMMMENSNLATLSIFIGSAAVSNMVESLVNEDLDKFEAALSKALRDRVKKKSNAPKEELIEEIDVDDGRSSN